MPPAPRVTVAICTYNRAHLVGRAIACARAQTMSDVEVVAVDDGSTDETPAVLADIDDTRLQVIRHAGNRGISRARNTAIEAARGEWVAFLDDDNEWAAEYLERQLAIAGSCSTADVVYCRARRLDERTGREMIVPYRVARDRVFDDLVSGWIPLMSCTLFRRKLLTDIGGLDVNLEASEDRDLFLRVAQRTDFAANADILVTRHEHAGVQLSRNYAKLRRDADRLSEKWREPILAACGWVALRRWRAMLVSLAEMAETALSVEQVRRADGMRSLGRMARHLPWSMPALTRGVFMLALGLERFGRAGLIWSGLRASLIGTARAKPYHRA